MPKRIVVRGGMADSSLKRNGWTFDAEGLAALASDNPEAPIVIDHDGDIAAVAGHLTKVSAKRGMATIQVTNKDGKKESRTIPSVFLSKEGILTEESPAFPLAWQTVQSYTNAGKIPQTSFSIGIDGIDFDEERDSIFLQPPYRLFHDAIVQVGAFGPDTGVGIMEIEVIDPDGDAAATPEVRFSEDGDEATVSCSPGGVHIANLSVHVASFSATHADNPTAMAALRTAFPSANQPNPQGEPAESSAEGAEAPEDDSVEANHQPLNTVQNLASTRSHMADSPPDTPENDRLAALEATITAMKAEREAEKQAAVEAEQKRVASLRSTLKEEFEVSDERLAKFTTSESLEAFLEEKRIDARVQQAGARGSERQGKQPDVADLQPGNIVLKVGDELADEADEWRAQVAQTRPLFGSMARSGGVA